MYENHWMLTRKPFENWIDESLYYPSEVHQTALLQTRYAIESKRSAIALCGDSGIGKSFLIQMLFGQLEACFAPQTRIVFPQLESNELAGHFADKLTGSVGPSGETPRVTLSRIEKFLDKNAATGHHPVVVIDEAHTLHSGEQLETLRLLLNLGEQSPHSESAWTLLLVGHSTLISTIERNRAFDERLSTKCLLHRFTSDQTAAYLSHRLQQAGGDVDQIFTAEAIDTLHLRSAGIPRRINRLADLALMVGFAEELVRIDAEQIDGLHQELVTSI